MLPTKPRVKRTKTAKQALESLMRLCARAERCKADAMRLMHGWEVPFDEREGVLRRLVAERYIDDRRYAEAFVREKSNLSAWGEYKIRSALKRKGIAECTISTRTNKPRAKQRTTHSAPTTQSKEYKIRHYIST